MAWMSFLYGKDKIKGYVACFFKKSGISEWYGAVYKHTTCCVSIRLARRFVSSRPNSPYGFGQGLGADS
jgi:hypothetical protein